MRFPVTIEIRPSRRLRAALAFVHLAAMVSLALALSPLPALASSVVLAVSLALGMRADGTTGGVTAVTLKPDGTITLRCRESARKSAREGAQEGAQEGAFWDGAVVGDSTAFGWLLVLRVRIAEEARIRALVILADSVADDDFRRLQVWQRWIQRLRRRTAAV